MKPLLLPLFWFLAHNWSNVEAKDGLILGAVMAFALRAPYQRYGRRSWQLKLYMVSGLAVAYVTVLLKYFTTGPTILYYIAFPVVLAFTGLAGWRAVADLRSRHFLWGTGLLAGLCALVVMDTAVFWYYDWFTTGRPDGISNWSGWMRDLLWIDSDAMWAQSAVLAVFLLLGLTYTVVYIRGRRRRRHLTTGRHRPPTETAITEAT